MPGSRCACRRSGAGGGPGPAAKHRRDTAVERLLDQLRTDEMNMRVDAAGGDDAAFPGDHLGARADHDVDPGLDVGVAGFADAADAAVADPDIGLHDTPMVEDHGIGYDSIDGTLGAGRLTLSHPVADDLATAELDLFAVNRAVALDLDNKLGIGQPQTIPGRRAEHRSISLTRQRGRHRPTPACRDRKSTRLNSSHL